MLNNDSNSNTSNCFAEDFEIAENDYSEMSITTTRAAAALSEDDPREKSPEHNLLQRVVDTCMTDRSLFLRNPSKQLVVERYYETCEWLYDDDSLTPFSFVWIVNHLAFYSDPLHIVSEMRKLFHNPINLTIQITTLEKIKPGRPPRLARVINIETARTEPDISEVILHDHIRKTA